MPHLSTSQKQQLARQLTTRQSDLRADVRRELSHDDEHRRLADEARDAGDFATVSAINDVSQSEIRRSVDELRAIESSLRRLASPDYGMCIACGDEIPFERLRAQPTAVRCSRCQSVFERTFAGYGRGPTL